jgi:hypothetical protein
MKFEIALIAVLPFVSAIGIRESYTLPQQESQQVDSCFEIIDAIFNSIGSLDQCV